MPSTVIVTEQLGTLARGVFHQIEGHVAPPDAADTPRLTLHSRPTMLTPQRTTRAPLPRRARPPPLRRAAAHTILWITSRNRTLYRATAPDAPGGGFVSTSITSFLIGARLLVRTERLDDAVAHAGTDYTTGRQRS